MFHMYCMGLPVVAPDVGILPAYVVPVWNGELYRHNDSLVQVLEKVLDLDRDGLDVRRMAAVSIANSFQWGQVIP